MKDLISRQDAIEALTEANLKKHMDSVQDGGQVNRSAKDSTAIVGSEHFNHLGG